jgi:hypothetical protein
MMTFDFPKLAIWMTWISMAMVVVPGAFYVWYMIKRPNSEKQPSMERPDKLETVTVKRGVRVSKTADLH